MLATGALRGAHVHLVPLAREHLGPLVEAALEDRATFGLTTVPPDEPAMAAYLDEALADAAADRAVPFVQVAAASGRVLGSTRFCNLERWRWPTADAARALDAVEIGWTWIRPSAQRTAVNSEAKLLLLRHAFTAWRVRRVTLKTDARNARSRAAIERLGAKLDGVLRAHMPAADGGVRDSAVYSILAAEWPAVEARLEAAVRSI